MPESNRARWTALGTILIAAIVPYLMTLRSFYVSDDFVLLNFATHATIGEVLHSFFPGVSQSARGGFYRPLGLLLWKLGYLLGGTDPLLQHGISILLHAGCVALVWRLFRAIGAAPSLATAGAITFALFPTHAEAVTWLAGRFDLLVTLCILLALLWTLGGRRWLGIIAFVCALGAKEIAVVTPLLLAALLVANGRTARVDLARALVPMVAVGIGYAGFRWLIFGGPGGYIGPQGTSALLGTGLADVWHAFDTIRLFSAWPVDVQRIWAQAQFAPSWGWALAVLLACGIALRCARVQRPDETAAGARLIWLGVAWWLIAVLPLLTTGDWDATLLTSSRLLYLPSVGVALLLVSIVSHLGLLRRDGHPLGSQRWRWLLLALIWGGSTITVVASNQRWYRAGEQVRAILDQIKQVAPALAPQTTFVLPPLPDNRDGAFVFRNGIEDALRLVYNQDELTVVLADGSTEVPTWPDRLLVYTWRGGELVHQDDTTEARLWLVNRGWIPGLTSVRRGCGEATAESCVALELSQPVVADLWIALALDAPNAVVRIDGRQMTHELHTMGGVCWCPASRSRPARTPSK